MALGCHSKEPCQEQQRHTMRGHDIHMRSLETGGGCELAVNNCGSDPDSKTCILRCVFYASGVRLKSLGGPKWKNTTRLDCHASVT